MKKLCPDCETPLESYVGEAAQCPKCGWSGRFRDGLAEPAIPEMMLPYVSIDLETTGLKAETCQILEFGAVFDDWTKPLDKLPRFHRYIAHDVIVGQPFALQMNAAILKKIALRQPNDPDFCSIQELVGQFREWMFRDCGWMLAEKKITPAGKNFASFDRDFLMLCGFDGCFHHRTMDPAPLFWQPQDEKLPDSKTCMERAGIEGEVAHTAVEDALGVVRMVRFAAKRILKNS